MKRLWAWVQNRPRPLRIAIHCALALALVPLLIAIYFLAALVLGALPVNRAFTEAESGVEVFVWSNGVHTDYVVPLTHEAMDWRPWFSPEHFKAPPVDADYVAFGWGDRGFFLNVPEWSDLTLSIAFNALVLDGESAMHVTRTRQPGTSARCRRLRISTEQYGALVGHITNSFRLGTDGKPVRIDAPGYGTSDAFYEARGKYGPIRNCNEWTGRGLRKAGVKTGVWTPLERSVMGHLPGE